MTNAPPSVNSSDQGSLTGTMNTVLQKFLMHLDDMLPATVIAFDRTKNLATVQPLIMMVNTNDQKISRAQVAAVPVFQIGAGGFMVNFNLKPGDVGFIKANDRDISLFMQSFSEVGPNTYRMHTFEDAVFFPSVLTGYTIDGEDTENMVIQTLDGTQRVSIWPDRVKITSDARIVLDAPLIECTGPIVTGTNPAYGQYATFNGTMSATVDVLGGPDAISLVTHTHDGVVPGGGNTGEPNP